jgi:hypothetical protein
MVCFLDEVNKVHLQHRQQVQKKKWSQSFTSERLKWKTSSGRGTSLLLEAGATRHKHTAERQSQQNKVSLLLHHFFVELKPYGKQSRQAWPHSFFWKPQKGGTSLTQVSPTHTHTLQPPLQLAARHTVVLGHTACSCSCSLAAFPFLQAWDMILYI